MQDAKDNIAMLHSSFGVTEEGDDGHSAVVDVSVLRASLMLPKGQELLARSMEGGCLPHSSACVLLPHIICILFRAVRPASIGEVSIAKEERLCSSLTSLLFLRNPSVNKENLIQGLEGIIHVSVEAKTSLKKLLGYKARAEVMHAVLARGGEMFKSDASEEDKARWLEKEAEFSNLLSSA